MKVFDAIWARVVKIISFLMGIYIMYHETIVDKGQKPYLYAAAIAMMGLQVAETLEKLVEVLGFIFTQLGKKGEQ